jgi:hypothetical protein
MKNEQFITSGFRDPDWTAKFVFESGKLTPTGLPKGIAGWDITEVPTTVAAHSWVAG